MSAYDTLILGHANLVHYWQFDELAGTSAADSKGVLNGTISAGARTPTLGQSGLPSGGNSFLFNGDTTHHDSSVGIGSFSVGGTAGLSLETWIYLPTSPSGATQIALWSDAGCGSFSGQLHMQSDRSIQWAQYDGSGHTITSNGVLSTTTWHHLVGVSPQSGTMTLYVDGVAQTITAALGTPFNLANAITFWIGGGTTCWFDANYRITRTAIYNAPLSGATVLAHYNAGIAVPGSSKLAGRGGGLIGGGRTGRSGLVA